MSNANSDFMEQLEHVLTVIPQQYVGALLTFHKMVKGKNIEWAVSGDLGEALKAVKVDIDCIEILTSKEGAGQIMQSVQEVQPTKINHKIQQIPRNAIIEGKEYSVFIRSHFFEFSIDSVRVKVHGDLQFRVDDWDWGDKLIFSPEYVYVVGHKMAVVPLSVKYDLYERLGWTDRLEKIKRVVTKQKQKPIFR